MTRYEDLVQKASQYVKSSQVDAITIPVGPRLGNKVLEANGVTKVRSVALCVMKHRAITEGLSMVSTALSLWNSPYNLSHLR